ncbi:hypothetical protein EST38_g3449 [Candolleomyces aberdarensis]|uniref:BTB domain-containing protein n=1 Tax=Candolleomyces aberdarensis TaxID=2316362 RepID=A0A4V1Q4K4_9AGAR|nr:hypothetical protein EST38_g3449 [Candolleomyces aberdarensis]
MLVRFESSRQIFPSNPSPSTRLRKWPSTVGAQSPEEQSPTASSFPYLEQPWAIDPTPNWTQESPMDAEFLSSEWATALTVNPPEEDYAQFLAQNVVSVSTSFYRGSHWMESDLTLGSSDAVLFYVHRKIIEHASPTALRAFTGLSMDQLQEADTYFVPESSMTLNIILHAVYETSCAGNAPTIEQLVAAVDRMSEYGLDPKSMVCSRDPLYHLLLSHGALRPLTVYALAAHHNLEDLATHVSGYLLSHYAEEIDDQTSARIGAVYLKRFLMLVVTRPKELNQLLIQPPARHPPTDRCGYKEQNGVTKAWSLGLVDIVAEMRPGEYLTDFTNDFADLGVVMEDLPINRIQSILEPLATRFSCKGCQVTLLGYRDSY